MIQRAVTAIIGVVIGLFATFAVFGAILGGLDNFYLLTRHACNYGTESAPDRLLRVAVVTTWTGNTAPCSAGGSSITANTEPDDMDWAYAYDVRQDGTATRSYCQTGKCRTARLLPPAAHNMLTPTGDLISVTGRPTHRSANHRLFKHRPSRSAPPAPDVDWIEAEGVFTAQGQLVTLLAVIAAIGMPLGAMTAVVFFGQAVVSSGVSGQGASQVLVAIAAVVIILVAVQMFQQFAGYLGDAFDAVDGDRFVVFNETLGSLAETIAEFWGVLAFAGLINIATIVWRNYNGNMSIGGLDQGGGGGRGL